MMREILETSPIPTTHIPDVVHDVLQMVASRFQLPRVCETLGLLNRVGGVDLNAGHRNVGILGFDHVSGEVGGSTDQLAVVGIVEDVWERTKMGAVGHENAYKMKVRIEEYYGTIPRLPILYIQNLEPRNCSDRARQGTSLKT